MPEKKKTTRVEKSRFLPWSRTISRDLVVSLVLTVTIVVALTISINYFMTSKKYERQNRRKAAVYMEHLRNSLELPLWYLDLEGAELVVNSFFSNEMVEKICIKDPAGNVLLNKGNGEETDLFEITGDVTHLGKVVGVIEIGLSKRISRENNLQLLKSSIIILLVVVAVLILATRFLLKVFLQNPLGYLHDRIDLLAKSEYGYSSRQYKQREIETIISKFNDMGERIRRREETLEEINIRLQQEIEERKENYPCIPFRILHGLLRRLLSRKKIWKFPPGPTASRIRRPDCFDANPWSFDLLDAPLMIHYNDYGWSYEDYVRHPRTAGSHAKVLRMAVTL